MNRKPGVSRLFLLFFWGRDLLYWFSGFLTLVELHTPPPPPGTRLCVSSSVLHSVALFYSLRAFSTQVGGGMKMIACQSLALELKVHTHTPLPTSQSPTPTLQWALTEEQSITLISLVSILTLCSPILWPSVFISGMWTSLQSTNFTDFCGMDPCSSFQGRRGSCHTSSFCWTSA